MRLVVFLGIIILGAALNFILKINSRFAYKIARCYVFLALLLAISYWVIAFAGIQSSFLLKILSFLVDWGGALGNLILSYLIIYIFFAIRSKVIPSANKYLKKIVNSTLWSVSILTGNVFLISTVDKATNFAGMSSFFISSGYAIWFLYFIMVAECLGGLGILFHFKLRTGNVATVGLMFIMEGAIYTNWRNGDPFSDGYVAIILLITFMLMIAVYYFERKLKDTDDNVLINTK